MGAIAKLSDQPAEGHAPLKPMTLGALPDRPLVSILTSNHNYSAYLTDAIESSLHQTYDNFEVVICDDGSTDDSSQILNRYQSQNYKTKVIYQANGGQASALNAAFRASSGEIICFLDADDVFMPDKLRSIVNAFAAAQNSGLAVNRMLRVDKARKYLGEAPLALRLASGWQGPALAAIAPQVLTGLPPCSGLSLRRAVAEVVFPIPSTFTVYADLWIQMLAPLITPIVAIQTPLSEYRIHGANFAAVSGFTEEQLRKLAVFEREIWEAWCKFLVSPQSALPMNFPPARGPAPSLRSYAYHRFRSGRRSESANRALPQKSVQCLYSRWYRWYWRTAVWMPDWLFRPSFNFVYAHTPLKLALVRILAALHRGVRLLKLIEIIRWGGTGQRGVEPHRQAERPIFMKSPPISSLNEQAGLQGKSKNGAEGT